MKLLSSTLVFSLLVQAIPAMADKFDKKYDNYFTDADELKVPKQQVRPWIDKAIKENDPEIVASIPMTEMLVATPQDIADLIAITTKKGMGQRQAQWLNTISQNKLIKVPQGLDVLARAGGLSSLMEKLPSKERTTFIETVKEKVTSPLVFAGVIIPLLVEDSKGSKLEAFRLMDRARKLGHDSEIRKELAREQSFNGHIARFIEEAYPIRLPILIAHRGGNSKNHPENTLELVQETLKDGLAEGIEIDISMTKDNAPVLWHDEDPSTVMSRARATGIEGESFSPEVPSDCLDPVSERSLSNVRKILRYLDPRGNKAKARVPVMEEIFMEIAKTRPDLKMIVLDIKTPAKHKDKLISLGDQIAGMTKKYKFEGRVVCMHTEEEGAKILTERSQGVYSVSLDVELPQPITIITNYTGTAKKDHIAGRTYSSMGRPYVSQEGWSGYLAAVRSNTEYMRLSGTGQKFMAWTINDEVQFRELLGTGVEYVLTDNIAGLSKVLREYKK